MIGPWSSTLPPLSDPVPKQWTKPCRRITVTSSLNASSTDQLGNRVVARGVVYTYSAHSYPLLLQASGQIYKGDLNGFSSTSIFASWIIQYMVLNESTLCSSVLIQSEVGGLVIHQFNRSLQVQNSVSSYVYCTCKSRNAFLFEPPSCSRRHGHNGHNSISGAVLTKNVKNKQ